MINSTNVDDDAKCFEEYAKTLTEHLDNISMFERWEHWPSAGTPEAIALEYTMRDFNPVPVLFRQKRPSHSDWQNLHLTGTKVSHFFGDKPQNIGVQLGPNSGGLTDFDLDCHEAIAVAPAVLLRTGAIFGRGSKRNSHFLYYTTLASKLDKAVLMFKDPVSNTMLLEVRIGGGDRGAQTVFPGSVHESGEEIKWEKYGEPAQVDDDELLLRGAQVAALSLLARYWPAKPQPGESGGRHDAALTLGGFLARCGLDVPHVKLWMEWIARAANDEEWQDRVRAAHDAATAYHKGERARGFPALKELFGSKVAEKVAEWLDYDDARAQFDVQSSFGDDPNDAREASPTISNDIVTEDSAAQDFVDVHGDSLRYCHTRGGWFRWENICWKRDATGQAFHYARKLARRLSENQDARKRYITNKTNFSAGVERFSKHDPVVAVTSDYWDRDPWLLGTPGGTVDLRTGKLRPSSPGDGITKVTAVTPDHTGCPRWLRFMVETTGDDGNLIRFLQQWCGYCLTGITREHALVFVYGPGGNGKSVFLNTIMTILKDYAVTSAMETFTVSKTEKHPTDLAMLAGARLVTASETEEGRAWAEARIKALTGGDPISARFMRRDFFTYVPAFKLIVIGNHKPVLQNVDDATKRRFNMVPFTLKPANPDRELEQKLMQEAPAILQWMIDGCLDWQQNGLIRPECVIEATAEYFSDQDLFRHWMEEDCICEPGNMDRSASSSSLFKSWSEFAKAAGHKPGTTSSFKDNLTAAGFKFYRGEKVREFFGISLRPETAFDED